MKDMLEEIFKRQEFLQKKLGVYPTYMNETYIKDMTLASIVELTEVLNETPWKPWKKQQKIDREKYAEELADVLHFIINLCLAAGITPNELYTRYINKNKINQDRNKGGY
jgi:dimeric dUTPase (all-alpha-NTP-PPase superfamily)